MRVLLSEASSLTAREHLTVLGRQGVHVDLMTSNSPALGQFSRWRGLVHRAPSPSLDPLGYLEAVAGLLSTGRYDALLPTHEQAWLFAAGRRLLPSDAPLAVAPLESFERVAGKHEFCRLLDELDLPQPDWAVIRTVADIAAFGFPCWLKADFATAGRGVRLAHDPATAATALQALRALAGDATVIAQRPAPGRYAQVGALFDHGRLIAVHCNEKVGEGAGGSAAARLGVDHSIARDHIARVGDALRWHGGLTLDYLHQGGEPQFIEANPRTVEPGNAAASGVDFPMLTVALSRGEPTPDSQLIGRPGARTHSAVALMLGAAERTGSRRHAMATLARAMTATGPYRGSHEVLTPVRRDPPSAGALLVATGRVLRCPAAVATMAADVVAAYSVSPAAVEVARSQPS
jgi:carbamoylphosphate synthase large subunit